MINKTKIFSGSYLVYLVVVVLAVMQIFISNRLSNFGKKINNLNRQTNELSLENERLNKKIASASALTTLSQKAKELGFTQKEKVIYLDEFYPVAQNPLKQE